MSEVENIIPVNIEDEMKTAYIDYSMSVIVSRALPEVKDGLKPVHRRVLYGMHQLGLNYNKSYKKSAVVVGEVLGKFHPHSDTSVYDAMVRMAQEWSLRYLLVDGQGNYGSMDGDKPAAMRYTEARLRRISNEMLDDINKNTVNFRPNFDDSTKEPIALPAKLPNLLLNGASGIAVGMATNMAPHNLDEVVNGVIAYIENPDLSIDDLMQHIKAPDFPTGGTIYGYSGVKSAFHTGRGQVIIRAKAEIEVNKDKREMIVVTEVPYMINKAEMLKKTASLINDKKIDGIRALRDESDRNGIRVVYELKKDAVANVVLNNLYKQTALQSSFSINNVALANGRPYLLNLKQLVGYFVEHRHEVVTRRTEFELAEAEKRSHILEGYMIALDNLDEVIEIIRKSKDPEEAKIKLIARFELSDLQVKAILEMRLQRLTGLERDKIEKEFKDLQELIKQLKQILEDETLRMNIIKEETLELKEKYGDERRSEIDYTGGGDFEMEDMIPNENVIVTVSNDGYIKRTLLSEYRPQSRGGKGSRGVTTKADDFTTHLFSALTHNYLLIFTALGRIYWLKIWQIPEGTKQSKGRAIQNLINLDRNDSVRTFVTVETLSDEEYINNNYIMMCTEKGIVKKTRLEAFSRPRGNGINALTIREGDRLLKVALTNGNNHVLIGLDTGRAINFPEEKIRSMGRTAAGVRGIVCAENEKVVGMVCVEDIESNLLVVTNNGYGKRSKIGDYRITNRGGKGVKALNVTDKTGKLVSIQEVTDENDLMIINQSGIILRTRVSKLRVQGRTTQGVRLITLKNKDQIASVTVVKANIEEDENLDDTNQVITNDTSDSIDSDATDSPNETDGSDNNA